MKVLDAVVAYPSHRYCLCTGGGPDDAPYVVVEQIDYGPHLYEPKPGEPPRDAVQPLCKTCRGTHGPSASAKGTTSGLVVPGG
ncbi:hypothetical protein [Actinoplanes lobatus]|nr:hypothetical protein [Actinoplanes lobatus]MBB4752326.1 hypothetical protein [Actinoplanes lobatus]